jgi:hypothetical protein
MKVRRIFDIADDRGLSVGENPRPEDGADMERPLSIDIIGLFFSLMIL